MTYVCHATLKRTMAVSTAAAKAGERCPCGAELVGRVATVNGVSTCFACLRLIVGPAAGIFVSLLEHSIAEEPPGPEELQELHAEAAGGPWTWVVSLFEKVLANDVIRAIAARN